MGRSVLDREEFYTEETDREVMHREQMRRELKRDRAGKRYAESRWIKK